MIVLKSPREIALMRRAGDILADVMTRLQTFVEAGMSTQEIDEEVEGVIVSRGATPAFKGYRGFPATVCISINDEIVHGIPNPERRLAAGDNISIDCGAILQGWHSDSAVTVTVGEASPEEDLKPLLDRLRPGQRLTLVAPIIFDLDRWQAPWTELVRVRSGEWQQYVSNDRRFSTSAIEPVLPLEERRPNAVQATVFVKTSG